MLCTVTQPMSQADMEAGRTSVTLTAQGVVARGTSSLPATAAHTVQPAVTQIKTMQLVLERTDALGEVTTNGERGVVVFVRGCWRLSSVTARALHPAHLADYGGGLNAAQALPSASLPTSPTRATRA